VTDPFIIMCAPNGARRTKADHPAIPISPDELADCAEDVLKAGASILHLHVRGEDGTHSLSVNRYREALAAIHARVGSGLVVQVTSEAVGLYSRDQQIAMVKELQPEAVSLALREICPTAKDEPDTAAFFAWMKTEGVFPQIILYDREDVTRFERMRRNGVFAAEAPFVLYVLGKYRHGEPEKPQNLHEFTSILSPSVVPWAACGFADHEHNLATKAAESGGHVRVGFENNLMRPNGAFAEDNAELVNAARKSALEAGRHIATAADVRCLFMRG